jgi:hypothetical protein
MSHTGINLSVGRGERAVFTAIAAAEERHDLRCLPDELAIAIEPTRRRDLVESLLLVLADELPNLAAAKWRLRPLPPNLVMHQMTYSGANPSFTTPWIRPNQLPGESDPTNYADEAYLKTFNAKRARLPHYANYADEAYLKTLNAKRARRLTVPMDAEGFAVGVDAKPSHLIAVQLDLRSSGNVLLALSTAKWDDRFVEHQGLRK